MNPQNFMESMEFREKQWIPWNSMEAIELKEFLGFHGMQIPGGEIVVLPTQSIASSNEEHCFPEAK